MPKFFIRTVNTKFNSRDEGREYVDVHAGRRAAIAAATDIATEEIKNGAFSVIIEGYVEEENEAILAKVVVALCVGDVYLSGRKTTLRADEAVE